MPRELWCLHSLSAYATAASDAAVPAAYPSISAVAAGLANAACVAADHAALLPYTLVLSQEHCSTLHVAEALHRFWVQVRRVPRVPHSQSALWAANEFSAGAAVPADASPASINASELELRRLQLAATHRLSDW